MAHLAPGRHAAPLAALPLDEALAVDEAARTGTAARGDQPVVLQKTVPALAELTLLLRHRAVMERSQGTEESVHTNLDRSFVESLLSNQTSPFLTAPAA